MAEWIDGPDEFEGLDLKVTIWESGPFDPASGPHDVTAYVAGRPGITINRGRPDEFDTFPVGTCTLVLRQKDPTTGEAARVFDVDNPASPHAAILKPRRRIQVTADDHALFTGFVTGWPARWERGDLGGTVALEAVDALAVLARMGITDTYFRLDVDRLDVGRLGGQMPQQRTGERIRALVAMAGFGTGAQAVEVDRGITSILADESTADLLAIAQDAEQAEEGFLFVDRAGTIRFFDRHARFRNPWLTDVAMTLDETKYSGWGLDVDDTRLRNDVRRNRPGGPVQVATDRESIREHGRVADPAGRGSLELPFTNDAEARSRADFRVSRYAQPQRRPTPIRLKPRRGGMWADVLTLDVLRRLELERTPLGIPPTTTHTVLVQELRHQITSDDWEVTVTTSPVDVDDPQAFMQLDVSQLDASLLAY